MIYYGKCYIDAGKVAAVHIQPTPIEFEPVELLDSDGNVKDCQCIDFQIDSDQLMDASEVISQIVIEDNDDVICKGEKIGKIDG